MSKERKRAAISKPLIDEEAVLRFAEAAARPVETATAADHVTVTFSLKKEHYAVLERESARKGRTVEEQLRKLLAKHLE
jgi:hypothetical protein